MGKKSNRKMKVKGPRLPLFRLGGVVALSVLVLLTMYPSAVMEAMQRSLTRCAVTVIPSLFPFLVAAELLVRSGAGEKLSRGVSKPICRLFGISRCGAVALMMGMICGFPVGMRTAAAYARRGELSEDELNHLLCFCNVPSTAFLINAVGESLLGSRRCGQLLLVLTIVSAFLVGILYRWLFYNRNTKEMKQTAETGIPLADGRRHRYGMMGEALSSAAGGMLNVVATVLFFGAVLGAVNALPLPWNRSSAEGAVMRSLLVGVFEITGGVCEAAALSETSVALLAPVLCAAIVGWAGLSVHFQLASACDGFSLHLGRFWLFRLLQALLCAGGMLLALKFGLIKVAVGGGTESTVFLWGDGADGIWYAWAILNGVLFLCSGFSAMLHKGWQRKGRKLS